MSRAKTTAPKRSPGRPRAAELDDAILAAALQLLAEQGYARMSLDAVAQLAGVGKPTLYRRWASKADLATAALASRIAVEDHPPAAAAAEPALIFLLEQLCERLLQPNSMALVGTLLAEERQTPELIALFRDRVWRRRAEMFRRVLERGRVRGEVRQDLDVDAAIHALIGSIYARYISGGRVPRSWATRVARVVLGSNGEHQVSSRR